MNGLKQYNTFDLLDELVQRTTEELELGVLVLLREKKIDYKALSNMYVKCLEEENDDKDKRFLEAVNCVWEQVFYHKQKEADVTQRSLYLLNKSNAFQMKKMNEKYNYNEEEAKKFSWYEREKAHKQF